MILYPSPSRNRRADVWFWTLTVLLSILILANMWIIYALSNESPAESDDRSEGITDVVVDYVYPDIDEKPPEVREPLLQNLHHLIRKLAHFTEYALLGILTASLIMHLSRRVSFLRPWLRWAIPLVFCLLYAVSDEVHQIFTGRNPAATDVCIDFAGAVLGVVLTHLSVFLICRIRVTACRHADASSGPDSDSATFNHDSGEVTPNP